MSDWYEDPPIFAAVKRTDIEDRVALVQQLLAAGADPNSPAYNGHLPLGISNIWHDHVLMRTLLQGGADPNAISTDNSILSAVVRHFPVENTEESRETR